MSRKTIVNTRDAAPVADPYSQATMCRGLMFTSGQLAVTPDGQPLTDHPIRIQTRQFLENISAILNEAGTDVEDILKATIFLKNIDSYAAMNTAYDGFFESDPPARTAVKVGNLPLDADVEIQANAVGER